MTGYITEINYDKLIEKSLKHVVVEALKIAERQGLPGENHFYITFKTTQSPGQHVRGAEKPISQRNDHCHSASIFQSGCRQQLFFH